MKLISYLIHCINIGASRQCSLHVLQSTLLSCLKKKFACCLNRYGGDTVLRYFLSGLLIVEVSNAYQVYYRNVYDRNLLAVV